MFSSVSANEAEKVENIKNGWASWLTENDVNSSIMTLFHNGKFVDTFTKNANEDDVVPMAQLSEAITAVCVADTFLSSDVSMEQSLSDLYGYEEGPYLQRAHNVSVADLINHTSGIASETPHSAAWGWVKLGKDPKHREVTNEFFPMGYQEDDNGYRYSNENYAILASILEDFSEQSYESFCNKSVLIPSGVKTATLETNYKALSSWAGWGMTTKDYAKFISFNFGKGSAYQENPYNWPHAKVDGTLSYGFGTFFDVPNRFLNLFGNSYDMWNHGALCFGDVGDDSAFYTLLHNGWLIVVTYDTCLPYELRVELENAVTLPALAK